MMHGQKNIKLQLDQTGYFETYEEETDNYY